MDGSMRTRLQTWLESPPARFFVTHLSGAGSQDTEASLPGSPARTGHHMGKLDQQKPDVMDYDDEQRSG